MPEHRPMSELQLRSLSMGRCHAPISTLTWLSSCLRNECDHRQKRSTHLDKYLNLMRHGGTRLSVAEILQVSTTAWLDTTRSCKVLEGKFYQAGAVE